MKNVTPSHFSVRANYPAKSVTGDEAVGCCSKVAYLGFRCVRGG